MIPDFSGRHIDAVLLDYGLRLWTDDNWELLLAGPVTVSVPTPGPDGPSVRQSTGTVDVPRPDLLPEWADLVGRTIAQVLVSARGDLGIVLDDRQLSVAPSPDYEAWQVAGHDGERLICGPGGRVTHFSPTRRAD